MRAWVGDARFDRAAILRDAHSRTRWLRKQAVFPRSYRDTFPSCLREAWRAAREHAAAVAELAAFQATEAAAIVTLPADVARQVADLRIVAEAQSFTSYGAHQRKLILAQADELELAARNVMIPATESIHVAH